jgi:putative oxidoreductase
MQHDYGLGFMIHFSKPHLMSANGFTIHFAGEHHMSSTSQSRNDVALLLLRLAGGGVMLAHGLQKLLVYGIPGITQGFTQQGIPLPGLMGPFITILEIAAPVAIILGLLTRLASLGLFFDMLGAMTLVHMKNGFFAPTGIELVLLLASMYLVLIVAGPGKLSIDNSIAARRPAVELR